MEAPDIVVPCVELAPTIAHFESQGYRLELVAPADEPAIAVVSGHGVLLRLDASGGAWAGIPDMPPAAATFELTRAEGDAVVGRAGMHYRDLLPDRQGGRFIASAITIPDGGPVPDYVHHHGIRFQMIYCRRGWVRVVYEDQGAPFTLTEGDCVLQPPHIRHRVLESSPGLEVIELTCPAVHATHIDHALDLPTGAARPGRDFGGQHFVRHEAARARWDPWRDSGFEARDTGIATATDGLASVRVVRATTGGASTSAMRHHGELLFWFVTRGSVTLQLDGHGDESLTADTAVAVPPGVDHSLAEASADLELLEVAVNRS